MKIYIAGKITGDPDYKAKFDRVANVYAQGNTVLSPAELPGGMSNLDYMSICLSMINSADLVVFLPDWRDSPGARLEHAYCQYVGKLYAYA